MTYDWLRWIYKPLRTKMKISTMSAEQMPCCKVFNVRNSHTDMYVDTQDASDTFWKVHLRWSPQSNRLMPPGLEDSFPHWLPSTWYTVWRKILITCRDTKVRTSGIRSVECNNIVWGFGTRIDWRLAIVGRSPSVEADYHGPGTLRSPHSPARVALSCL